MVMFTSDGASVMLGKLNGVAAQLKRDIPHLVQQHCVAHREDLGMSNPWKEVKLIKDIEILMRTVYMAFCRSSRRKCKFQKIVDASESIVTRDFNFGIHQVKSLCSKNKDFLAEEIVIVSQYNDFKFAVAERVKSQLVLSFLDMVTFAHQNEQFQDLAKLMDIGGTFLASSTDCERGFSLMNTLKNKLRNHLQVDHLDMLMCIKSYQLAGELIDLDRVYIEWANEKDCREKQ
ncbi:unnamed protein product [Caretta caretta]